MKRIGWFILVIALLLTGCQAVPTFETLGDVFASQSAPEKQKIQLSLPADATAQTVAGDNGIIYFCDGYEIALETFASGDLDATIRTLTGFEADALTVMQTKQGGFSCYECVWTSAGEEGFQISRTKILDDGSYHYSVTVFAPEAQVGQVQQQWQQILDSFRLGQS